MNLARRVGARIREERDGKGLCQHEIGPRSYVADVERGVKNLTLSRIEEFARILHVDAEDLFKEARKP